MTINLFFSTIISHMKNTFARPMFQVVLFMQPLVISTTTFIVFRNMPEENLTAFTIAGGGMAGIWSAITFSSAGDINRERWYGTLPSMLGGPSSLVLIFAAKITANAILSLISMIISAVYSWLLLGIIFPVSQILYFLVALFVFVFSSSAFALCLSSIFLLSRSTAIMQNFLEYPLLLLGGVVFPVNIFPKWLQVLGALLPMRWGSEALRLSLVPTVKAAHFGCLLAISLASGIIYCFLSYFLFRKIEYLVRNHATLELI